VAVGEIEWVGVIVCVIEIVEVSVIVGECVHVGVIVCVIVMVNVQVDVGVHVFVRVAVDVLVPVRVAVTVLVSFGNNTISSIYQLVPELLGVPAVLCDTIKPNPWALPRHELSGTGVPHVCIKSVHFSSLYSHEGDIVLKSYWK
jgi:hypothetical protein